MSPTPASGSHTPEVCQLPQRCISKAGRSVLQIAGLVMTEPFTRNGIRRSIACGLSSVCQRRPHAQRRTSRLHLASGRAATACSTAAGQRRGGLEVCRVGYSRFEWRAVGAGSLWLPDTVRWYCWRDIETARHRDSKTSRQQGPDDQQRLRQRLRLRSHP